MESISKASDISPSYFFAEVVSWGFVLTFRNKIELLFSVIRRLPL
jgi:hypothetical protein